MLKQVEDLLSRHRGLTSLNLSGLRFADEQLLSHIHAQLNLLNKLELGSHPLSEGQLNAISQLQVLTWLQISDSNLGRFGPVSSSSFVMTVDMNGGVRSSRVEAVWRGNAVTMQLPPACWESGKWGNKQVILV